MENNSNYYNSLGIEYHNKGKPDIAQNFFLKAIKINPGDSRYFNNLGIVLHELGKFEDSICCFLKAISIKPDNPELYYNLGITQHSCGKPVEAGGNYLRAISLKDDDHRFYNNLGNILQEIGKYEEAIESYMKALDLKKDDAKLYSNLGVVNLAVRRTTEAVKCFTKALEIAPDNDYVHFNYSNLLLILGDFENGWKEYEWRDTKNKLKGKLWDGSVLEANTLIVVSEQGFGDTIQFSRYIPLLKEKAGKIVFVCQRSIAPLIQTSFIDYGNISVTFLCNKVLNHDEEYINLMSLPGIFKTTLNSIPVFERYLKADEKLKLKWLSILGNERRPKIGFTWAANSVSPTFFKRSYPFKLFYELIKETPEFDFISLQKGDFELEPEKYPSLPNLKIFANEINDFSDTAALIENLDLVISIDTSVVHLAGALGKKVWNLLPLLPEWRWLFDTEESKWYPTMKLFRQKISGDWDFVLKKVKIKLNELFGNTAPYIRSDFQE